MKYVDSVVPIRERRKLYKVLVESQEERDHLEDINTDKNIILKWILNCMMGGLDSSVPGLRLVIGSREHGTEPSTKKCKILTTGITTTSL
jgi:hypothetical protein